MQQWNIGWQVEALRDTAVEVRYVGNRGTDLVRAIDLNQLLLPEAFVDDFRRAQRNLAANGHPGIGEPLLVFPRLGLGGYLDFGAVQSWIRNGEIGQYIGGFLAPNRRFFFAGEGGEAFGATLPIGYFYTNPNTYVGDVVGNYSFSEYNALQLEVRRAWRSGFTGQLNYTWGRAMTDFGGSQANFRAYFDNARPELEIMRPDSDITHTINANWVWEIPVGEGRRWLDDRGLLSAIVGGWGLSGFVRIRSGEVINIVSQRGTINRGSRALVNTVHLDGIGVGDLQNRTGVYRHPDGRVSLFDDSLLAAAGGNLDVFRNPGHARGGDAAAVARQRAVVRDGGPRAAQEHRAAVLGGVADADSRGCLQRLQSRQLRHRPVSQSQQPGVRPDQLDLRGPADPGRHEAHVLSRARLLLRHGSSA